MADRSGTAAPPLLEAHRPSAVDSRPHIDALHLTVYGRIIILLIKVSVVLDSVITISLFCLYVNTFTRGSHNLNGVVASYQGLCELTLILIRMTIKIGF